MADWFDNNAPGTSGPDSGPGGMTGRDYWGRRAGEPNWGQPPQPGDPLYGKPIVQVDPNYTPFTPAPAVSQAAITGQVPPGSRYLQGTLPSTSPTPLGPAGPPSGGG